MPPKSRAAKGVTAPLSSDRIVSATLELAVVASPNAISFRRLGEFLGVDPTAIYRHISNRRELVAACLDRLMVEVLQSVPPGLAWRERLTFAATSYVDELVDRPSLGIDAGHVVTGGPGELGAIELTLGCLAEAGLDPHDSVRYYSLISSYCLASAAAESAFRLHAGSEPGAGERLWAGPLSAVDPSSHPRVTAVRDALDALSHSRVLMDGLTLILDSVEREVASGTPGRPPCQQG